MKSNCEKKLVLRKRKKIKLLIAQISLFVSFVILWELMAKFKIIDEFLFSSPSAVLKLLGTYLKSGELFEHIGISVFETVLGIVLGSLIGIIIAIILWCSDTLAKIFDPFLVVLNALPKTALAPIMIIWAGTGVSGIVVVAISILIVITIISTYNYFINVDKDKIKMLKSFKASKIQVFTKLIFPSNLVNIINVVKINIGMSWIGVIVGEFLVSRAGIGYLIMYGGQVFKLDLVMMGVAVLAFLAFIMWKMVDILEKYLLKRRSK